MFKFLSLGAINTLFTLAVYQLLLFFFPSSISYVISWCLGFAFLIVVYPKVVFGVDVTLQAVFKTSVIYLSSLLLGFLLVNLFERNGFNSRLLILLTIAITSVYNYYLMKFFLKG